jgi:hypothetical protein
MTTSAAPTPDVAAAPASNPATTAGSDCPACHAPRNPGKICQNCGTEYATGVAAAVPDVMPDPLAAHPSAGPGWYAVVRFNGSLTTDAERNGNTPPDDTSDQIFQLTEAVVPFGRTSKVLPINDGAVSRAQGEFRRNPDGTYSVVNVSSSHSIAVNKSELQGAELRPLKDGDVIDLMGYWTEIAIQERK